MALSVDMAARRICDVGSWQITNLALQKILYLAHMYHLGSTGLGLVADHFEAWDYGPVLPSLYRKVSMFGAKPIKDIFRLEDASGIQSELKSVDFVAVDLVGRPAAELVSITHWADGAWAKNYRPGLRGIVIPDADILDEYRARTGRSAEAA